MGYQYTGPRVTTAVAGQATVSYTWDDANRLTQITQGTDAVSFGYDNANRRTSTTLANGVAIAYGYDAANQLTSITYTKGGTTIGDLAYAYDAAGRRTSVSGSLAGSDLPAAVASVIGLTDASGVLQTQYSYEPYGKTTRSGAGTTNSQTYTGREDDGTGIYYYRSRYYSGSHARFIAEDRIGSAAGMNLYAYAGGSPAMYVDPLGTQWQATLPGILPRPIEIPIPRWLPKPLDPAFSMPRKDKGDDGTKDYCTRLYELCDSEQWGGDWTCHQCHFYCTGINEEWPFWHCSPDLKGC